MIMLFGRISGHCGPRNFIDHQNDRVFQVLNELVALNEEEEKLYFFENRLALEKAAKENLKIAEETAQRVSQ